MDAAAKTVKPEMDEPWSPRLFGKQWDVFNSRNRIVLVDGPRHSAKTWVVLHKLVRHMWETPGAQVGIFAKTKTVAKDQGIWNDLTTFIIGEWIDANIGLEWVSKDNSGEGGPKQDGATRTPFFSITNFYGGVSECRLFSVDYEPEIAAKVKQKRFSMIYFPELSVFKDQKVLSVTLPSLRMPHLVPPKGQPDIYHQWIADTNPDEVLGKSSWIYQVFYVQRNDQNHPDSRVTAFRKSLAVYNLHWKDNPFVSEEQVTELYGSCYLDQNQLMAHYEGIWPDGASIKSRHFVLFYNPPVHVIGTGDQDDSDQIAVSENSVELFCGWDMGYINHASILMDKWYRKVKNHRGEEVEEACWSVLDEHVILGDKVDGLAEFTRGVMDKMDEIEEAEGKTYVWNHYTDSTALNVWRPSSASYDAMEVEAASRGKIILQGVEKPEGSVRARVRLVKMLLKQKRLFISFRCVKIREMMMKLSESQKDYVIRDEHSHPFDAMTYVMIAESSKDLLEEAFGPRSRIQEDPIISL